MKKTIKKTLAILVAILMIVTSIPFAFAAGGETRVIYSDESSAVGAEFGLLFYDDEDNELSAVCELVYDGIYAYTVSVDAVAYHWFNGVGGGGADIIHHLIPDNVDFFDASTETWSCSHQMGASLVENGAVSECDICGEKFRAIYIDCSGTWGGELTECYLTDENGNVIEASFIDYWENGDKLIVPVGNYSMHAMMTGYGAYESSVPDNADTYYFVENTWYCSHNLNTSGAQTCQGQICQICGENYGEADPYAHDWSNCDGICMNGCGYECAHADQTGSACEVCGATLHTCDFNGEWKHDSENHWKECTCGAKEQIASHEDTLVQAEAKAPTCSAAGYDAYEYCTACTYTTYVELPAITHTDANCDYKCDYNCGYEYETLDFSDAKVLSTNNGYLYIDGEKISVVYNTFNEPIQNIPGGKYILGGDMNSSGAYAHTLSDAVSINLNGYTWDFGKKYLSLYGALSVYDTSIGETGKMTSSFQKNCRRQSPAASHQNIL